MTIGQGRMSEEFFNPGYQQQKEGDVEGTKTIFFLLFGFFFSSLAYLERQRRWQLPGQNGLKLRFFGGSRNLANRDFSQIQIKYFAVKIYLRRLKRNSLSSLHIFPKNRLDGMDINFIKFIDFVQRDPGQIYFFLTFQG